METRKVQKVGGGTYTVSIPVQWANEHGVEAGGTAYLYTHSDGSLVVRWNEGEDSDFAATTIGLGDADPGTTEQLLRAAYTAGFDRVTLRAADGVADEQRRAIHQCVRTLSGVDVTDEGDDRVTVEGLLDASDVSVRQSVLQLRFITLSMLEAATAAVVGESREVEHVIERNAETDRIARLVERHCNRSLVDFSEVDRLGTPRPELFAFYRLARQLEQVADHAAAVARAVQRADRGVPDGFTADVAAVGDGAREVVEDASEVLVNGTGADAAHAARARRDEVVSRAERVDEAVVEQAPEAAHLLTRATGRLARVAEHGGSIADLALQASLGE